jgi:Ca-activated chloride channel family protein
MSLPLLTITSQLAREPLPVTGEQQVAFLLVEVRASEALAAAPPMPLNLALVLDRSGSMRGPRLQYLKDALKQFVDHLTPNDTLAIVTFDDMVELIVPAGPVTEPEKLNDAIDLITDGGGTAMALGLSLGLAELHTYADPTRLSRMILLTDGVSSDDAAQCVQVASEAGAEGFAIMPIGFGAEWDDAQLEAIGMHSGGEPPEYVRAPADIAQTFMRQLRAAQAVKVPSLALEMRFVAGVTPRRVTRVTPFLRPVDASITARTVAVPLGDLEAAAPQSLLIELLIEPKRSGTFRIAQIETNSRSAPENAMTRADVVVTFSASANKPPQMRPVVLHYVERVNAARIVLRAIEEPSLTIAPNVVALFDAEGREQLERLRAGVPLSPEGRNVLMAKVRGLTRTRRKPTA